MPLRALKTNMRVATLAACVSVLPVAVPVAQAQSGPFSSLAGAWTGTGTINMSNGSSERIRCRATYAVGGGGNTLQQNLRCASDSYRFELASDTRQAGGSLSGTWSEATRGVRGDISGTIKGSEIRARAEGPGFAANLAIATRGAQQSVSIRASGGDIVEVSIALSKSGR